MKGSAWAAAARPASSEEARSGMEVGDEDDRLRRGRSGGLREPADRPRWEQRHLPRRGAPAPTGRAGLLDGRVRGAGGREQMAAGIGSTSGR
jgi:hypothetical protein